MFAYLDLPPLYNLKRLNRRRDPLSTVNLCRHPQMRMCTYCGEARAAGADMARHIGLKHEPRARCFQCGQSMAKSLYGQHLIDGHGWSEGNPEGGDRRCR